MKFSSDEIVKRALKEDIGSGDVTTRFFLSPCESFTGTVYAREKGIVCGVKIAEKAFRLASKQARIKIHAGDGAGVRPGTRIMTVTGDRNILAAERTALNFLQRLSGIATLTSKFVKRVCAERGRVRGSTPVRILDTRKTTPGLRRLEKYAVACGGGTNHRTGLYDAVLIKDNHIKGMKDKGRRMKVKDKGPALQGMKASEFVKKQIMRIRRKHPKITVEMEAQNLAQVRLALDCAVDIILLDNMPRSALRRSIAMIRSPHPIRLGQRKERNALGTQSRGPLIEVSGGINLKTAGAIARLGPDRISVGQLTHSPKAIDISFEIK